MSNDEKSRLFKLLQLLNIPFKLVTFFVLVFDKFIFVRFLQSSNILLMFSAAVVSNVEISSAVSALHFLNIMPKSVTCDVLNGIAKDVKEEHSSNIPCLPKVEKLVLSYLEGPPIIVTLLVSKLDKSNFTRFLHP